MSQTKKQRIYWYLLAILYVVIGITVGYSLWLWAAFPLLAAPLAVALMVSPKSRREVFIMHISVIIVVTLLTQSNQSAILYVLIVAIPAHVFDFMNNHKIKVPHMIMYMAVSFTVVLYSYSIAMRIIGIDYIGQYIKMVDDYKGWVINGINQLMQSQEAIIDPLQLAILKEVFSKTIDMLKTIYPALFLIITIISSTFYICIVTFLGKLKKYPMQPLTQLTQFTFSKYIIVVFAIGILLISMGDQNSNYMALGLNIQIFVMYLLELLGMLVVSLWISKRPWKKPLKVIAIVLLLILMSGVSMVLMIIGLTDVVFNFRKAKIIV